MPKGHQEGGSTGFERINQQHAMAQRHLHRPISSQHIDQHPPVWNPEGMKESIKIPFSTLGAIRMRSGSVQHRFCVGGMPGVDLIVYDRRNNLIVSRREIKSL